MSSPREKILEQKLKQALEECAQLRQENTKLRGQLNVPKLDEAPENNFSSQDYTVNDAEFSIEEKLRIFSDLFRGRGDVFAKRWENKKGRSGYSPACKHEWVQGICEKPRIKCSDCMHRKFIPLTDQVIYDHLAGKQVVGMYPLLQDETCYFLAVDFDKEDWLADVGTYSSTCKDFGLHPIIERSRSGKGGHVWLFFTEPVSAILARKLGSFLLTQAMEKRHQIGLESYDRFFPNQDTMPKGGFGNLIALPLQREPRSRGNSLFINADGSIIENQWQALKTVKKITPERIQDLLRSTGFHEEVGHITHVNDDEEKPTDQPWKTVKKESQRIQGPFPEKVSLTLANMVYIEKHGLPTAMLNRMLRIAAFQNPEFYKAQAMRLSTYDKPRIIRCGEDFDDYVAVPRGCLDEVCALLKEYNIVTQMSDERHQGSRIKCQFVGELRATQNHAVKDLLKHDIGVLSATTAFGKTVVASHMIAKRKVNTLVIVHRKQLMDQWKEQLAVFLDVSKKSIGEIGGGKDKPSGCIDIAMMQSLHRQGETKPVVADYGHVIIDECHHVSAFSFEQVLKNVRAKYILGLTATPVRKDGHHPIITMQCGPIRHRVTAKDHQSQTNFEHIVIPRHTHFRMPMDSGEPTIQDIYAAIINDEARNQLITDDLIGSVVQGRSPLVLTERTEHLEILEQKLRGFIKNIIILRGGMGKKQRQAAYDQIANLANTDERVILATGRYIGEGFDDSRLDTLFLVSPISWKGTLQQYAGRLHRSHANKSLVQVYDYVDHEEAMLRRMYQKRLKGYAAMGYSVKEASTENQPGLITETEYVANE